MDKLKIMLSSPIENKTKEEIDNEKNELANVLFDYFGEDNMVIISPIIEKHTGKSELEYFCESIFCMSNSNALVMGGHWADSRECKLMYEIADAYDVPILFVDELKRELEE